MIIELASDNMDVVIDGEPSFRRIQGNTEEGPIPELLEGEMSYRTAGRVLIVKTRTIKNEQQRPKPQQYTDPYINTFGGLSRESIDAAFRSVFGRGL